MMGRIMGSLAFKLASMGLTFLVTMVLARNLTTDQFGLYSLVLSIVMVSAVIAGFGLPSLVVREFAGLSATVGAKVRSFRGFAVMSMAAMTVLVALVLYLAIVIFQAFSSELATFFGWIVALIVLMTLLNYLCAELRGFNFLYASQTPNLLARPLLMLLLVLAALGLGRLDGARTALSLYGLAALLALVLGLILLVVHRRDTGKADHDLPADRHRIWTRTAVPLMLSGGIVVVNQNIDIVFLGALSDQSEIAVYKVCAQVSGLLSVSLNVVALVANRQFARLHQKGDAVGLERLARRATLFCLLLTVPLFLVCLAFGAELLDLAFGSEYAAGAPILAVLAAAQALNASFGIVGAMLNMTGHERATLTGVFVAASVNAGLNLTLIPVMGAMGAAIALLVSTFVWNMMLYLTVCRRLRIQSMPYLPRRQRGGPST